MRYPDVPRAPGVPPVLRTLATLQTTAVLLAADALLLAAAFEGPRWGVFDQGGQLALDAETFVSFDFRKEYRNATFPVEEGGYGTYNKVETPYDARLTVSHGGTEEERVTLLDTVDSLVASLDLYTIITPEATYDQANVVHYDYKRTQRNGATLLIIDLWVDEVRVVAAGQFIAAQDPSGATPVSSGQVQAAPPASRAQVAATPRIQAQDASYRTGTMLA